MRNIHGFVSTLWAPPADIAGQVVSASLAVAAWVAAVAKPENEGGEGNEDEGDPERDEYDPVATSKHPFRYPERP